MGKPKGNIMVDKLPKGNIMVDKFPKEDNIVNIVHCLQTMGQDLVADMQEEEEGKQQAADLAGPTL